MEGLLEKEIKLPKVGVTTAKLYEKAGFGHIVNELPFQCRVQLVLRKKHNIDVFVIPFEDGYNFAVVNAGITIQRNESYFSYENALEAGLQVALKLLVIDEQF